MWWSQYIPRIVVDGALENDNAPVGLCLQVTRLHRETDMVTTEYSLSLSLSPPPLLP